MNPQDDLDRMLQGDDQPGSPAKQDQGVDLQQQDSTTPEEVEFNSLPGSTQDRIRKLARDKRDLLAQLEQTKTQGPSLVPPAPGGYNPQDQIALKTLSDKGVALKDDVKREIAESNNALRWQLENGRLEGKWHGQENTPAYVQEEVESFIQAHSEYRSVPPEVVFKSFMFPQEFLDYEIKKRGSKTGQTATFKPTKQSVQQEQGMSVEYIMERTDLSKYPDALQWQEEHKDEIDKVLQTMQ